MTIWIHKTVTLECDEHGETNVTPFQAKFGCPVCNMSSKELALWKFFKSININFDMEVSTWDLTSWKGAPLRFDFALKDAENEQILCLIEYDGEQHFPWIEEVEHSFDSSVYYVTHYSDRMKYRFCYRNGIPLIRIPYFMSIDHFSEHFLKWLDSIRGVNLIEEGLEKYTDILQDDLYASYVIHNKNIVDPLFEKEGSLINVDPYVEMGYPLEAAKLLYMREISQTDPIIPI